MDINTSLTKENTTTTANKVLVCTSLLGCQVIYAKIGNVFYHFISIILSEQFFHHSKLLGISLGLDFQRREIKT